MKTSPRQASSSIERLEARIAPASVVMLDINKDIVKFTSSSPAFGAANVSVLYSIDGHNAYAVDLTDPAFAGSNFSVTVTKAKGGDGVADIAQLSAGSNDLGTVNLGADLEAIIAGSGSATVPAIKALTVSSLGRFEAATDAVATSTVTGSLGALTVKGNMDGTDFSVSSTLASITIGGSLLGGGNNLANDGHIFAKNLIGKITIKGDVRGSGGTASAFIDSASALGPVTVGGSIYGGDGTSSAGFGAFGDIASLTVGGSVYGGAGKYSGGVSPALLGKVTIGGSLVGGAGDFSGSLGADRDVGSVTIGGSVEGATGNGSGTIYAAFLQQATLGKVTVGGSLIGGAGSNSGMIGTTYQAQGVDSLTSVSIGHDIVGGSGASTGGVLASGTLGTLTLKGSVVGGTIEASGAAGTVVVEGSLYGATSVGSGSVQLIGGGRSLTIGGSLYGGSGNNSGYIQANEILGALTIHGDVLGGAGSVSGSVQALSGITKLTIDGLVLPGTGSDSGMVILP